MLFYNDEFYVYDLGFQQKPKNLNIDNYESNIAMTSWIQKTEYQIFIGCHDQYFNNEYVTSKELKELIVEFFTSREVDFSLFFAQGGYLYEDGNFQIENSVCVNIIGANEGEIIQLAKNLSMYMSQESSLIIKNPIKIELL